jgi:sugar phosphate isomerase/epimerase
MMNNLIVPLNAFDRFEVLENGQASYLELISQSGAFGVEIRRELLPVQDQQLEKIRYEIEKYRLFTVYSAPIELWKEDFQINGEELTTVFQEGMVLGAKWIKVSLGHFQRNKSNVLELNAILNKYKGIQLLVENDQTLYGGNVSQLQSFFESVIERNVPVQMTFDAGNWYYTGQDVENALSRLAPYVIYLHLKQVESDHGELITVPLQTEGNNSWKMVMRSFPIDIVKALEFPIEPKEKTKEYLRMITELALESEALS